MSTKKWNGLHDEPTILAGVSSFKSLDPSACNGKEQNDTTFGECYVGSPDITGAAALITLNGCR